MLRLAVHAATLAAASAAASATGKPHIISILQDDLGYYDSGIHSPEAAGWTKNITALAKQGIVLTNHYAHWHCSPTRRSFLTGRLPIHHGEDLSGDTTDDIDLRMAWVSTKLASAGYVGHWFGKWHTGFKSMAHLGASKGFATAVGSFQTGGPYSGPKHSMRWQNDHPIWQDKDFQAKPENCPDYPSAPDHGEAAGPAASLPVCSPGAFLPDTEISCGHALKFTQATSAAQCCADCAKTTHCTHWVYNPDSTAPAHKGDDGPCHVKAGDNTCRSKVQGVTAGTLGSPSPGPPGPGPPPPPPLGNASCTNEYSTDLWGQLGVQALQGYEPAGANGSFYLHLCFQAVHTPYDQAPGDPTSSVYRGMLWRSDVYIGELVRLLSSKAMWAQTLIVYSADNGGVGDGLNYPLRGEKHSNWEGGMRTAAFVSGGLIPPNLRGTTNGLNCHVVDWLPTFASLAGVDATDDPPVAPLPTDPSNPAFNIYGNHSFPPLDGVDIWPMLMAPDKYQPDGAHKTLVLSKQVLIAGRWKLMVASPHFKTQNSGWKGKGGSWRKPNATEMHSCIAQDPSFSMDDLPVPAKGHHPCLFDLRADPGEHWDVSGANPEVVQQLWAALNATMLGARACTGGKGGTVKGPTQPDGSTSCSPPALLGPCNTACATAHWAPYGNQDGPICGVPGCTAGPD